MIKEAEDMQIIKDFSNEEIKNMIYTIRGKQVMFDDDLAKLFHCKNGTKSINLAVKRNIERFPERYMFQLLENELNLRFQNETSSLENKEYGGRRYLPYVFTEQGIAMLSSVLRTNIAISMSIRIMDAFVEMRKFLSINGYLFERINNIELKQAEYQKSNDKKFEEIFDKLQNEENIKQKIFFKGQIWDSYSVIIDIIKDAQKQIIIIDNYIDDSILKMLTKKNKGVEVLILTSPNTHIKPIDVEKFNKEYPILKVQKTNRFHDRFIIIDNKELYHCGASIKDLGTKCFAINQMEDISIIEKLKEA